MMKNANRSQEESDRILLEQVEEALFRRATGYEDASGKAVLPDVRAAMYWLENRFPERWKKRQENSGGSGEISFTGEENAL